jgi:hypothetical protein
VFSCILQVLEENLSNSNIITKAANSFFDIFKLQNNFEFKEREVGKKLLFFKRIQNEHVSVI